MNIIQTLEEYDKRLQFKISNLETQVQTLTAENEELKQAQEHATNNNLIQFLLGKLEIKTELEFDGRDFAQDLRDLIELIAFRRSEGEVSRDDMHRAIPWHPTEGCLHRWLDKKTGFINTERSERKMELDVLRQHIEQRDKWIGALLIEYDKLM